MENPRVGEAGLAAALRAAAASRPKCQPPPRSSFSRWPATRTPGTQNTRNTAAASRSAPARRTELRADRSAGACARLARLALGRHLHSEERIGMSGDERDDDQRDAPENEGSERPQYHHDARRGETRYPPQSGPQHSGRPGHDEPHSALNQPVAEIEGDAELQL